MISVTDPGPVTPSVRSANARERRRGRLSALRAALRAGRLLALLMVAVIGFSGVAGAAPARTSLPEIEDEVMCPICGTLLSLSRAPAAERERVFIRKLIRQGKTKDEIKDALVAEYGGQVLALPENQGIDVWAYLVPVIGFSLAAIGVIGTLIRWRLRRPGDGGGDHDSGGGDGDSGSGDSDDGPGPGPDGGRTARSSSGTEAGDIERLERDLARYDL